MSSSASATRPPFPIPTFLALEEWEGKMQAAWWEVRMVEPGGRGKGEAVSPELRLVGFADKVFPPSFSFIAGSGIMSM